jgi:hypothetical protein
LALSGYQSEPWHDFFVAEAGAAAALAGLLFVALSMNIRPILATPPLTTRAGGVLSLLANVLLVATVSLVPDQSSTALAMEILIISGLTSAGTLIAHLHRGFPTEYRGRYIQALVALQLGLVPFLIAGVTLLTEAGGGLYWIAAGVVLSFFAALGNAWVLLVEILR